ncbi:complex I intermediate-associated protein 30 (CIA30) [Algoriphagus yeomjeoni]|uniref:Complex I intermediate-associated protein 30 (CIA30) n=2 Tax=Algoriphagus yeomjeoni TaxID=291403 RepID=A0A327PUX6_9BACT|nr:complex I intermediate-associated protein 30 (CIA30) [Algoriphagus yeomjeoni]
MFLTAFINVRATLLLTLFSFSLMLYQFDKNSSASDWRIVDDVVMGGRSDGSFRINEEGNGVFEGSVSLENNGGFSSVRHRATFQVQGQKTIKIRLKGDGSNYQFRVKADTNDRHSYIADFQTSGDWQTVEIQLSAMYPAFRGRNLSIPNFNQAKIEEIAFLIGNKKAQTFRLEIKSIELI